MRFYQFHQQLQAPTCCFFFFLPFLYWSYIYKVVLISDVQQRVIQLYSIAYLFFFKLLFHILFPLRLLHNIEQSFLCSTVGPRWWSIVNTEVCTFWQAPQVAPVVKNPPAIAGDRKRYRFNPWVGKIPWRRKWQPTPVFFLGESHGQRSLAGYSPRGHSRMWLRRLGVW